MKRCDASRSGEAALAGSYLDRGATFGHSDGYHNNGKILVLCLGQCMCVECVAARLSGVVRHRIRGRL